MQEGCLNSLVIFGLPVIFQERQWKADWNLCSSLEPIYCWALERWAGKELSFGSFPEWPRAIARGLFILSQASFSRQESFLLLPGGSSLGCHNSGEGPANIVFGIHLSVSSQCLTSLLSWILEASFRFLQTRNFSFTWKWQNRKILGSEMSNRQFLPIHHFQHSWFLSSKIPCISLLGPPYGKRVLWG